MEKFHSEWGVIGKCMIFQVLILCMNVGNVFAFDLTLGIFSEFSSKSFLS